MAVKPDEDLEDFEERLRVLKNKYDQFFAGIRKMPPITERRSLDVTVHEMSKEKMRDNTRRFRFNTILSRYNQYREMWARRTREREEGPIEFRKRSAALAAASVPEEVRAAKPPVRVTSDAADPYVKVSAGNGTEATQQLFERIRAEHDKMGKSAPLTIEQLTTMIQKQTESLKSKYQVQTVAFRVETVDGKVKLKAKPVQEQ
jgi:hypothetical protein